MPNVVVPFTVGVEEIELVTIVDILRRANIKVTMASLDGQPVIGRSGITIQADVSLEDTMKTAWDMVVLPGGLPNAQLLQGNQLVKKIAMDIAQNEKYLAAICAAPAALASFGLLENKKVTSHPSVQKRIEQYPNITYLEQALVEDEHIITSRGAGTAIAFALHLVHTLTSEDVAKSIKHAILA